MVSSYSSISIRKTLPTEFQYNSIKTSRKRQKSIFKQGQKKRRKKTQQKENDGIISSSSSGLAARGVRNLLTEIRRARALPTAAHASRLPGFFLFSLIDGVKDRGAQKSARRRRRDGTRSHRSSSGERVRAHKNSRSPGACSFLAPKKERERERSLLN